MKIIGNGIISAICLGLMTSASYAKVTPTDAYKEAKSIKIAAANEVNNKIGGTVLPVIDIDLLGTAPHHVYSLAYSLNQKIGILMKHLNKSGFENMAYPKDKITPKYVKELLVLIKSNIKKIDSNVTYESIQAENKKPADVMREILYASLWVDVMLGGKIKPDYPYHLTKLIDIELNKIIKKFKIDYKEFPAKKYTKAKPYNVFLNASNFYSMLSLYDTTKNGKSNPRNPYDILSSGQKVKPSDVFTLSAFIISYLYYIETNLGIEVDNLNYNVEFENGKTPADVYTKFNQLNKKLALIIATLEGN
jgi:hypothetical protein